MGSYLIRRLFRTLLVMIGISLVVFVFMCIGGTAGPNRFGPDPKDPAF